MEQHPVPQNVTTFQFRLIGDMTIKQFGYLAGGAILAYISYKLPLPFFFTWPLALLFGLGGIGFAFVPIEERPMDIWVLSFIKRIYSPTQYMWQKSSPVLPAPPPKSPLTTAVHHMAPTGDGKGAIVSEQVKSGFHLPSLFRSQSKPALSHTIPTIPTREVPYVQEHIKKTEQLEEHRNDETNVKLKSLQDELTQVVNEKDKIAKELSELRQAKAQTVAQSPIDDSQPRVRVITADQATKAGLPKLTTYTNVITGIIKDTTGNLLPSVLVTVRDKEGVPLRALKTNKLGQFAASTQLPNGTYIIEIEDPRERYLFDRIQVTVNGTVMPPIEVIAKSQKEIERAKLAQQIFGNQS